MECVHENVGTNLVKAYMSWNVPNQKSNKRLTVSSILLSMNTALLGIRLIECYKNGCYIQSVFS